MVTNTAHNTSLVTLINESSDRALKNTAAIKQCWENCAYTFPNLRTHHAVNLRIYASSLWKIIRFECLQR